MHLALCLAFYLLALASGLLIAARVSTVGLLAKCLITFTLAAAQILLCIQLLALARELRPGGLFALDALVSLAVYLGARRFSLAPTNVPAFAWRKHPVGAAMLATAVLGIVLLSIVGYASLPSTDCYHFAMPLYWREYRTLTDFPASDPRLTGLTFAAEGLCFPGVLYANTMAMYPLLAAAGALLMVWIVVELAQSLGLSMDAALGAGALATAYGPGARALLGPSPEMVLSATWFLAAVYFLVQASRAGSMPRFHLGFSLLCVLMACGSKNSVCLQAPIYLALAGALLGRRLLEWRTLRSAVLWLALGLASSTIAWNYGSNLLVFHDVRGHPVLQETMARDLTPSAAWTRVLRGAVASFLDPLWLPRPLQPRYAQLLRSSVSLAGGRQTLPEDDSFYSFADDVVRPGSGLGPLGFLILAPSLLAALLVARDPRGRWRPILLAGLTLAAFALAFAVLRTQKIGVTRLLLPCVALGAPLAALLLEKRWARLCGFALLTFCTLGYLFFGAGLLARRSGSRRLAPLAGLMRDRAATVDYEWAGEPPQQLFVHEGWSARERYLLLLQRLPPGAVCGFFGTEKSTQEFFLFGPTCANTVYHLLDSRSGALQLQPIPADVQYLVSDHAAFDGLDPAALGFAPWLTISVEGKGLFAAWKRR